MQPACIVAWVTNSKRTDRMEMNARDTTHLVVYVGDLELQQGHGVLPDGLAHVGPAQMELPMRVLEHHGATQRLLPQLA